MSQDQIHVMDADGTDIIQLTTNETGAGQSPSWGPQSRFIMPTVTDLEPPNGADDVPFNTSLTITFNLPMAKGSGTILIRDSTGGGLSVPIDVSSPQVVVSANTVVIGPLDLHSGWEYQIEIPAGCFLDWNGFPWTGIGGTTGSYWVIHTAEAPTGQPGERAPGR